VGRQDPQIPISPGGCIASYPAFHPASPKLNSLSPTGC